MTRRLVLGLDTATPATTVALLGADGVGVEHRDDPEPGERPRHAERLLPLAAEVLADAGASWADVGTLAVGVGPGGFTGLRIGVATARALAQARDLALVGVSTLAALARGAVDARAAAASGADTPVLTGSSGSPARTAVVLAVLDARRGEVFAAAYDLASLTGSPVEGSTQGAEGVPRGEGAARAPHVPPLLEPTALAPEALAALVAERGWSGVLTVGDGSVRFRTVLEAAGARVPADDAPAHRVSALQVGALAAGGRLAPTARDDLLPDYRREPDAVPSSKRP